MDSIRQEKVETWSNHHEETSENGIEMGKIRLLVFSMGATTFPLFSVVGGKIKMHKKERF